MPNTTTLKVHIIVRGKTAAEFNVDEKIYLKNETLLEVECLICLISLNSVE